MPFEWALSIVVSILNRKGDIRNGSYNKAVKLVEQGMVVERALTKRPCRIVTKSEILFNFMPERGTINAVFILRRLPEEYHVKGKKLYMCFVDLEKTFD